MRTLGAKGDCKAEGDKVVDAPKGEEDVDKRPGEASFTVGVKQPTIGTTEVNTPLRFQGQARLAILAIPQSFNFPSRQRWLQL